MSPVLATPAQHAADSPLEQFLTDPAGTVTNLVDHVRTLTGGALPRLWLPLLSGLLISVAIRVALQSWRHRRLTRNARQVIILPPPQVDPGGAETLWATLHGLIRPAWRVRLSGQPHLAFEYAWTADRLTPSIWVPGTIPPHLVERAVHAAWPGAQTVTGYAAPPLPPGGVAVGGRLRLAQPEWYPLRHDHDQDPLRPLVAAAAGDPTDAASTAVVQILARPVGARRLARCRRAARALRTGQPSTWAGRLLRLLGPGPVADQRAYARDPALPPDVRAILVKAAGQGWAVSIRYAVATTRPAASGLGVRWALRRRLRGRVHALAGTFAVFDGRNRLDRHRLWRPTATLAARRLRRGNLLSTQELAALAHLPTDPAVPGLLLSGAKTVPPAPTIPASGTVVGDADAGPRRPIALTEADARHHVHLLGATGTGKSTIIINAVLQDVDAGRGAVVLDPNGDLVADLLDRLPRAAGDRLVVLDPIPADPAPPILNMLDGPDPELAVDHITGIFRRIFAANWGPRMDDILRSACLTLLRHSPHAATLADIPLLLSNAAFRRPYVAAATAHEPMLAGFWEWYEGLTDRGRAEAIGPVLYRLRAFFLRPFVRQVMAGGASSVDLNQVLDGGVLLARLPKGVLGEETTRLLGSLLLSRVWQAATYRARQGEPARADTRLYVDEAHNFLTLPVRWDEALAEARKYHLSLWLAQQYLAQLPSDLRDAIAANARNKLYFTTSPEDAITLERYVRPNLTAHDLLNLDAYQVAARLMAAGTEQPACTLRTRPAPPPVPGRADQLRQAARANHGRTRTERDQEHVRRAVVGDDTHARGDAGSTTQIHHAAGRRHPGERLTGRA